MPASRGRPEREAARLEGRREPEEEGEQTAGVWLHPFGTSPTPHATEQEGELPDPRESPEALLHLEERGGVPPRGGEPTVKTTRAGLLPPPGGAAGEKSVTAPSGGRNMGSGLGGGLTWGAVTRHGLPRRASRSKRRLQQHVGQTAGALGPARRTHTSTSCSGPAHRPRDVTAPHRPKPRTWSARLRA